LDAGKTLLKAFEDGGERETDYSCEIPGSYCIVCENYYLLGCDAV
jgi:hypothetical protein